MSKIKLFSLGGLSENGKNLFIVEVDNKIFVLDSGLKYPSVDLFGVDLVYPDISYLIKNKKRIQGIFLSHGHEDHIGAIMSIIRQIPVKVFATKLTIELVKDLIEDCNCNPQNYELNVINSKSVITFDNVSVSFFNLTHSIPECVGIAIKTEDGNIIYAPDYTFDQNANQKYATSFDRIGELSKEGVLCLMGESLGAERLGHTTNDYLLTHTLLESMRSAKGRTIVTLFSTDLDRIQRVIDVALQLDKKIAIIGRKTQRAVDIAINLGYLDVPQESFVKLRFIDDKNDNSINDMVALVTGVRHEPFYMIQRMTRKQDRLIHINNTDTVIMLTPPIPGTEKIAASTIDTLSRLDANVRIIDKKILTPSHASAEDIKLMINLLNPKYIMPIIGEYRHIHAHKKIALQMGYTADELIDADNGQIFEIRHGELIGNIGSTKVGDVLVDGSMVVDINEVVLKDRESLATDGVLLIIGNINARKKTMVTEPEIVSRGFIYVKDNADVINKVSQIYKEIITKHLKTKYLEWNEIKRELRDNIGRYLYKEIKRKPIVIPVLIDTPEN